MKLLKKIFQKDIHFLLKSQGAMGFGCDHYPSNSNAYFVDVFNLSK